MSSAGWYVSKDGFRIPKSDNALRAKWDADYLQRVKDYFGTPGREFVPTEIPVDKVAGGHNVMPGHPRTNFYARLYKLGEPVPPIVVSEVGTGFYNVLDGNRRIASAKMANKSHVPALLIRDTKKTSTTKAPHVYTPTKVKKLGKSEPLMAGAAFRHLPTGKIFNVGPWHDTTRLPGGLNPEPGQEEFMPREDASGNLTNYEAGFVDRKGKFYNRQEAAKAVGAQSKSTPQYARLTGLESRIYALGHDEGIYKKEQNLYCDIDLSKNERDVPEQLPPRIARALWAIRQPGVLTDELRKPEYRSNPNPFAGHCFVASDALMHLIDGHRTGWQLKCIHKEHLKDEDTHWFLQHRKTGHIIDPTADQFEGDVPYEKGVAKGTSQTGSNVGHPTKRAQVVIDRVKGLLNDQPYEYLGTLQHDGSEFYIQAPDEELEKAENGRRIPLDEIHKKYNFFHISSERLHPKGSKFWFAKPRVPESVMEGEDMETPRTCVGPSIHHCVAGVQGSTVDPMYTRHYVGYHVYRVRNPIGIVKPTATQVPDVEETNEHWLTKPIKLEYLGALSRDPNKSNIYIQKSESVDEPWERVGSLYCHPDGNVTVLQGDLQKVGEIETEDVGKDWGSKPTKGHIDFDTLHKKYKVFRIIAKPSEEIRGLKQGKLAVTPSRPSNVLAGENRKLPRVCVSQSMYGCIAGILGDVKEEHVRDWFEQRKPLYFTTDNGAPSEPQQVWNAPGKGIPKYTDVMISPTELHGAQVFALRSVPKHYRSAEDIKQYVPDAHRTNEGWLTQPEQMEHVGAINMRTGTIEKPFKKRDLDPNEGYIISHEVEPDGRSITVWAHAPNGEKVGILDVGESASEPGYLYPVMVKVHENHRRKGIATAMYQYAEKVKGMPFTRGHYQSPLAQKMWAQENRPFGKPFHKRDLDPNEGYTISHFDEEHESGQPMTIVVAYDKNLESVGSADLLHTSDGSLVANNIEVNPKHRRKGLASAMYQYAEKVTGKKLKPHNIQTSLGRALWAQSNRPFAKRDLDPSLGYKISSQPHPSGLDVMAHDKMGQQVGRAIIGPDARGLNIAHTVYVDEAHQRRGIASAMYQHAEKVTGQQLHPSSLQTEDAEALWASPHKFGKAESKLSPGGLRYRSDDGNTEEWDYSHLLPEKARDEGYRVRLHVFRGVLNDDGDRINRIQVFATKNQAGKSRPAGQLVGSWQNKTIKPWESIVEKKDRRKHLGQAMYEAMYAHGRAHLGATDVSGSIHSTSAHLVHKKLARKHGLNYEAKPNVGRVNYGTQYAPPGHTFYESKGEWAETIPHDYDAKYLGYKYKLPDVTKPKQVNMFAEHRLPGSLDAEGYKLNVAHTPEGAIGTIHRNGQVLGHIELNKDGRPFEEWTGNGRREGLRDAVLMILRGHQEGQAYQDGWNQPVKGSAPLTKAELSTPLTSSGNLSQYENMHKMQGNEGKHGIWNSLSEGQVISETTMQGLCKSENLLEVQCREGGLGIRNTTSERENLSKVSMQGLSGQSPSRANSSESREGRSSSLSQQPRIAGGGQEVSKGESRQHQGLAGRTEEYVKVSDGPTEGCSVHGLPSNVSSVCNGLGPSRPLNKVGERSLNARPLGEMGYSSGGSSEVRPGVFELSQNSNFHPSPQGSDVTIPHRTYTEASRVKPKGQKYSGGNNLWARNHSSESNADRTLAVQFSSDLLQGGRLRDASDDYYDKLYVSREGYKRPADFWEIPAWTSHLAYSLPDMDHYTVRDPEEAIRFLNSAGYKHVAFSALDVNKDFVKRLAQGAPNQHVVVGGYTDMSHFNGLPNVSVHPTIESFVKSEGREYQPGYDYRHFSGTPVIPRLTLSDGCRHNCTFCCVPKQIDEKGREEILQQADAFAEHIPSDLIYINDKTYGQAKNHSMLPELYQHIKAKNPNFKGFIVQTTAAQMKRFTPEFLRQAGIKHIELGVESVNDPILHAHKKPANEELIQEAADKIRTSGASLIPNIMVGLPGENRDTYARTLGWLEKNKDIISHVNAYNLALYDESELGKKLQAISAADRDENVQQKSWHTDPQVHKDFAEALWRFASGQLDQPIGHTQPIQKAERYAVKTPHAPPVDPENYQIYESPMGHHLLTPDNNEQWFSTPKKRDEYLEFHQSILGRPAGVTNLGFRKSELNKNEPVRSPYYQANEPGSYAVYQSPIGYHLVTARGNEQVFNSSGERDKYLAWHQSMGGKKPVKDLGFVQSEGALAKVEIDQNESIAVCIMVQDGFGRTLWGKRRKDGKFCMPGGHVEEGEAPAQAAVRELHEEVGLVPKTMWLLGSGNGIEGPVHVYHAICNGQATTANDPDREFSELVWEDCLRGPPPYITANLAHPRDIAYDLMGWRGPE